MEDIRAALTDHRIGMPDKLSKPVTFSMMGDGVWEIRQTPMGIVSRRVAKGEVPGLGRELVEGIILSVPRIPLWMVGMAVSFFRAVHRQHGSEAVLRIAWNPEKEQHEFICPDQEVSPGGVWFRKERMSSSLVLMADIHSHHTMRAYFSDTDDKDEKADLLYMVAGRIHAAIPELAVRLRSGGCDVDVSHDDVFRPSEVRFDVSFPRTWMDRVRRRRPSPNLNVRLGLDPCDPPGACMEHGMCWIHSSDALCCFCGEAPGKWTDGAGNAFCSKECFLTAGGAA